MKKCASCSKDLPDAALHCVFCGAKQAAAPAVQPGHAKTAFGYSANEVMQQLGNPQGYQPPQAQPYQPPQAQPYQPPQAQPYQPPQQPRPHSPSQPAPMGHPPSDGLAGPNAAANAKTMMVAPGMAPPMAGGNPGYGNPGYGQPAPAPAPAYNNPGYGQPAPAPAYNNPGYGQPAPAPAPAYAPPMQSPVGGMGIHSPHQAAPAPMPVAPPPYLASQTAARAGRPIEPWKDSLRFMMFVWGAVALASFAVPQTIDPMGFTWDLIIDGEGKMKIPPLIWASAGLLSIACAAIPMQSLPRGIVAAALGLAGIATPVFLLQPDWPVVLQIVGMLALIPGLLVRHEYVESLFARLLVTIGVVCTLLPFLIPNDAGIPLVLFFKALINGPVQVSALFDVGQLVIVVCALLAWMPGPATGGGKVIAWILILFPVVEFVVLAVSSGHLGDVASKQPGALVSWAPGVTYSVLVGYGLATVFGKQLE